MELLDENGEIMKFRGIDKYIVHKLNTSIFADDQAKKEESQSIKEKGQKAKKEGKF